MTMLGALSTGKAILLGLASGIVLVIAWIGAQASLRRPPRRAELDIPAGMKPGPSDPDLETPILVKLYVWATILVLAIALSTGAVFYTEPETNKNDTALFISQSIQRGHLTTLPGTEQNQLGFNCVRCHGPNLHGGQNLYNNNVVAVPNLQIACNHLTIDQIVQTIAQGRAGTDMPSWSVQFAGAMDDQQIEDVVNYLLSIQKVPKAQNKCLPGAAASPTPTASPSPGASGSPSASPSASP